MAAKLDLNEEAWVDLVFEERNKEYGAYQLRKEFAKNSILGIVFAVVLFSLAVSAPLIVKLLSGMADQDAVAVVSTEVNLIEPPPIDETKPPPPPVEPPPPLKTTIKFVPPVITKDEDVPDEPPPTVEELKEADAGVKTEEGDPEGIDESLVQETGEVLGDPNQVFLSVEQMPTFPGGDAAFVAYIQKNVKYPAIARENGIIGTVYIDFIIDQEGKPIDVKVKRGGLGGGLEEEAVRVIKSMPAWAPGKQNGRPARVQYTFPVKFKLQ